VASQSLQAVPSSGLTERSCAADAIAASIEPLGARQGRFECRLRSRVGSRDRRGRWLAVELGAD